MMIEQSNSVTLANTQTPRATGCLIGTRVATNGSSDPAVGMCFYESARGSGSGLKELKGEASRGKIVPMIHELQN